MGGFWFILILPKVIADCMSVQLWELTILRVI